MVFLLAIVSKEILRSVAIIRSVLEQIFRDRSKLERLRGHDHKPRDTTKWKRPQQAVNYPSPTVRRMGFSAQRFGGKFDPPCRPVYKPLDLVRVEESCFDFAPL